MEILVSGSTSKQQVLPIRHAYQPVLPFIFGFNQLPYTNHAMHKTGEILYEKIIQNTFVFCFTTEVGPKKPRISSFCKKQPTIYQSAFYEKSQRKHASKATWFFEKNDLKAALLAAKSITMTR